MALGTKILQFLDLTNYLAAGTSLREFYKAYNVKSPKGFFPYEWFDDLEKVKATKLPTIDNFYSILTNQTISEKNHKCGRPQILISHSRPPKKENKKLKFIFRRSY